MTFFDQGTLNSLEGLLMAAAIGVAFGFWLERAGFGSSRKLASIFYLRDFAVLKVMFTAIVTALLGLHVLGLFQWVHVEAIYRMETFLWPQIVGGAVFGIGFVLGGWCPGTAIVGLASGKADALVFLLGAGLGSVAYAFLEPSLGAFPTSGSCGVLELPSTLGLERGQTVLLVTALALMAFLLVSFVEARRRDVLESRS